MQEQQQPQMLAQPQGGQVQNFGAQQSSQYPQPQAQPQAPQPAQYQVPQPQPQPAPYQAPQGSDQYQQSYQPQQPYGYAQPAGSVPGNYYVSDQDKTLRLIAFIFNIISLVTMCWLIIPLAWLIPMCVISWGIYKGTKANTVAFGVCTLIFSSLVAGILLLFSMMDRCVATEIGCLIDAWDSGFSLANKPPRAKGRGALGGEGWTIVFSAVSMRDS